MNMNTKRTNAQSGLVEITVLIAMILFGAVVDLVVIPPLAMGGAPIPGDNPIPPVTIKL